MKKSKKTQLTALMFAAAMSAGCTASVTDSEPLAIYGPPECESTINTTEPEQEISDVSSKATTTTTSVTDLLPTSTTAASTTAVSPTTTTSRTTSTGSFSPRQTTTATKKPQTATTTLVTSLSPTEDTTASMADDEPVGIYGPPEWEEETDPTPDETETEDQFIDPLYGPPEWFE